MTLIDPDVEYIEHQVNLMPEKRLIDHIVEKYASRYIPTEDDLLKEKPADVIIWICA